MAVQLSVLDNMTLAYCLIFIDFFIVFGLAGVLFALLLFVLVNPVKRRLRIGFFNDRPVITFVVSSSIAALFFLLAPIIFFRVLYPDAMSVDAGWTGGLLHRSYLSAALFTTLCIGLSTADMACKPDKVHWWNLIFLFGPIPYFSLFPLLWWNAAATWVQSHFWRLLRPALLLTTFLLPLIAYPSRHLVDLKISDLNQGSGQPISGVEYPCDGYFIEWVPGKPEFYMRCHHIFYRVEIKNGQPAVTNRLSETFPFDVASIDYEKGIAYIFYPEKKILYRVEVPSMNILTAEPISCDRFPAVLEGAKQAFDQKNERLFLIEGSGAVASLDVNDIFGGQCKQTMVGLPIVELHFVEKTNQLFVLEKSLIRVLNADDLSVIQEIQNESLAYSMVVDEENNRYFVSYPALFEVRVYDLGTHRLKGKIPAPMGVRKVAVDPKNRLLFVSSMTGTLEIRSLDDFSLKSRDRVTPWIHWLDASPSQKKLLVSVNINDPFVYSYEEFPETIKPLDRIGRFIEIGFRLAYKIYRRTSEILT